MTKIYFVRHAKPVFEHADDRTRPLCEEGMNDCAIVMETLKDLPIDAFYCSPYARSYATIEEAARAFGLPIACDERLRERQSAPGGNGREALRRRWADHDWHEEGGESIAMVERRNIEALGEILERNEGKSVVIGTHGTALSTILHHYLPAFGFEDFWRIVDWMPYIVRLDFEGQRFVGMQELAHVFKPFKAAKAEKPVILRRFAEDDAQAVSDLIARTLREVNIRDYSAEYIERDVAALRPESILRRAEWTHFYVACEGERVVGCGAIGPYWDRTDESSLFTIFVLPEYQGMGVGRKIIKTLEEDEYFLRADRVEIPASITAVGFYQKMGYGFKNGVDTPDDEQLLRMEKRRRPARL